MWNFIFYGALFERKKQQQQQNNEGASKHVQAHQSLTIQLRHIHTETNFLMVSEYALRQRYGNRASFQVGKLPNASALQRLG